METIRTTSSAQPADNSQHLIPAQRQQATKQIPQPGNTTTGSVSLPADVAITARTPSIPADAACATPLLDIDTTCAVVLERLQRLADAMKQSNLPASEETINQLRSAINNARVVGNIHEFLAILITRPFIILLMALNHVTARNRHLMFCDLLSIQLNLPLIRVSGTSFLLI